ncbi:MAG: glutamate--tRNA ligase [Ectothiorhodospiraceae bacterium]|nr:glutamate--tRNA ligase [Ectothiorhodospiraceae bacterium]
MSPPPIKTRFAPSPTGWIHLGNLRTALFNALYARKTGGVFLLRIEDTDRVRSQPEYIDDLMQDLRWLGLDWQEGPQVEAAAGPYLQSQRDAIYAQYFDALERRGLVYPCFCSDESLKLARKAQLAAGRPPRYAGTCAHLMPDEVRARLDRGLKPTLRFRVADGRTVAFDDLVRGAQRFETVDIGDFVIRRSDGTPAFFFCNALDDALMGVTHVLRGEDHLANTPRQILLLEALGLPVPQYGHISLILGPDGGPLSKRLGAKSVRALRQEGWLPVALLNHMARLGHHYADERFMRIEELAAGFDTGHLGRAPARHDESALLHWQKLAVAALDDAALWDWLAASAGEALTSLLPENERMAFAAAVRDNLVLPADAVDWARRLYGQPEVDAEASAAIDEAGPGFFTQALTCLDAGPADFVVFARAVGAATGRKGKALFMPLRAVLTGVLHGPEMGRLWPLIGPERARERIAIHTTSNPTD